MKNFRKIITLSLVVAIMFSLSACGKSSTEVMAQNLDESITNFVYTVSNMDWADTATTSNNYANSSNTAFYGTSNPYLSQTTGPQSTSSSQSNSYQTNNFSNSNTTSRFNRSRTNNTQNTNYSNMTGITNSLNNSSSATGVSNSTGSNTLDTSILSENNTNIQNKINNLVQKRSTLMLYINEIYKGNVNLSSADISAINAYINIIKDNNNFLASNKGMVKNQINMATKTMSANNKNLVNAYIIRANEAIETRINKIDAVISATDSIIRIIESKISPSSTFYNNLITNNTSNYGSNNYGYLGNNYNSNSSSNTYNRNNNYSAQNSSNSSYYAQNNKQNNIQKNNSTNNGFNRNADMIDYVDNRNYIPPRDNFDANPSSNISDYSKITNYGNQNNTVNNQFYQTDDTIPYRIARENATGTRNTFDANMSSNSTNNQASNQNENISSRRTYNTSNIKNQNYSNINASNLNNNQTMNNYGTDNSKNAQNSSINTSKSSETTNNSSSQNSSNKTNFGTLRQRYNTNPNNSAQNASNITNQNNVTQNNPNINSNNSRFSVTQRTTNNVPQNSLTNQNNGTNNKTTNNAGLIFNPNITATNQPYRNNNN